MAELRKSGFCKSISGHDKGTVYVITEITGNDVYVADGKLKKLLKPKKKNQKHLSPLNYRDEVMEQKFSDGKLHDEDVKYSLKKYLIDANK